jgi:Protein of unknown function (DUF4242)
VADGRRFFLVERYLPATPPVSVEAAVDRLGRDVDARVRHLCTMRVPEEETCLSVFEAPDPLAVAATNERAGFRLDRIVEVEWFAGPPVDIHSD